MIAMPIFRDDEERTRRDVTVVGPTIRPRRPRRIELYVQLLNGPNLALFDTLFALYGNNDPDDDQEIVEETTNRWNRK